MLQRAKALMCKLMSESQGKTMCETKRFLGVENLCRSLPIFAERSTKIGSEKGVKRRNWGSVRKSSYQRVTALRFAPCSTTSESKSIVSDNPISNPLQATDSSKSEYLAEQTIM